MITPKSRMKQIAAEQAASLRILRTMRSLLINEFKTEAHPLFAATDVENIFSAVENSRQAASAILATAGLDPAKIEDADIVRILGSAEGERSARESIKYRDTLKNLIAQGYHYRMHEFAQFDATATSSRDRMLALQFAGFCSQAEAVIERLWAMLAETRLQFWVWDGVYHYAGQPKEGKR